MRSRNLIKSIALMFLGTVIASTEAVECNWEKELEDDQEVALRLYIPDSVSKIRALIVLTPGLNGDGRKMADDDSWRQLAEENQCGIVACKLRGKTGGSYFRVEAWAGEEFLNGLKALAKESGHAEVATAPLLLWGHSAGGQFNYNFACWKPEKIMAFVVNKGGYYDGKAGPTTRKIPALWISGEKDTELRRKNIATFYEQGRSQGALWAMVVEPGIGHQRGRSKELGQQFFRDVLAMQFDSFGNPKAADPAAGWLGDPETHEIQKNISGSTGNKKLSWFPGESTALLWQDVSRGQRTIGLDSEPVPVADE